MAMAAEDGSRDMARGPRPPGGRPMRRSQREITDPAAIDDILRRATVLCLALRDEPAPYAIPVNFGWDGAALYVHSAPRGTKIDLLAADRRVGFCAWVDDGIVRGKAACDWGARGSSVSGTGTARIVTDPGEKLRGLDAIMGHYGEDRPVYGAEVLARTTVIAIRIEGMRAKRVG